MLFHGGDDGGYGRGTASYSYNILNDTVRAGFPSASS
jgi:hypothetical protein